MKQENDSWEILPECGLEQMGFLEPIEDIEFQFSCSKEYMIRGITHMLENKKCTDVVVHVGNQSFKCHLPVLHVCTGYFKKLRRVDVVTLGTDDITPKGFELAYEWMTHPNAKPSRKHIVELYLAANFLAWLVCVCVYLCVFIFSLLIQLFIGNFKFIGRQHQPTILPSLWSCRQRIKA